MTINRVPHFDPFDFGSFAKTAVGFEPILDKVKQISEYMPKISAYPPYNIVKVADNKYIIEIAVAGFSKQQIELELQDSVLTVKGSIESKDVKEEDYIFKGIADRAFTRKFTLADTIEVKNADLINGMLKIWLERFVPEEKKPKKIVINGEESEKQFLAEDK